LDTRVKRAYTNWSRTLLYTMQSFLVLSMLHQIMR
jgi:hypothetical protein